MFLTVHATDAVIIAKHLPNPLLALAASFASHYILDAIPHGDEAFFSRFVGPRWIKAVGIAAIVDTIIMLLWLGWLVSQNLTSLTPALIAAVFGSIITDFLNGLYILTNWKILAWNNWLNGWCHHLITEKTVSAKTGFIIQILFFCSLVGLVWLKF